MPNIPEGFTAWRGGENPEPGKMVEIFTRLESEHGLWRADPSESERMRWSHDGLPGDIFA